MSKNVIEMDNITKRFGSFTAVDDVTFHLRKGEIHALLGENGAGKTTLVNVLFGLYAHEGGAITINGEPATLNNPNDANDYGIGMVHQHFMLVQNFTVLESIILGDEPSKGAILNMREARRKVVEISERYKLAVDPEAEISEITVGQQQRVEILKMLFRENEILIFDEPTAVLTPQEIDELMKIMRQLADEGKSIIFITHKLNEIQEVADRATILRKGKHVATREVAETSAEEMSELMVGRAVDLQVDKGHVVRGDVVFSCENITVKRTRSEKNAVHDVSLEVHAGEIVSIAGVDGNGQSDLVYALTGITPPDEGKIFLNGVDISKFNIRERTKAGMAHIPEDRQRYGLILEYTLANNLVLQTYYESRFQKHGFMRFSNIVDYADELIERFDIRSSEGAESMGRALSGGNQQKAIVARELDRDADIVIAVQPVRGLDVGAIEYIHNQLMSPSNRGKGVLLVSFELDEVMNLSDRILVMYEGEIVADLDPDQTDERELGLYMAGKKKEAVHV